MKILYYDCFSGISGDMNLAAMIDLGVPVEHLVEELKKLDIMGYSIEANSSIKMGITGTKISVKPDDHQHSHGHGHGHSHAHGHGHGHHHHDEHRTYKRIKKIILSSDLKQEVKNTSIDIFEKVAIAEAKIHSKTVDDVHFHEVGAIDSIVDIVGAAICFHYLKPDKVICSSVQLGGGFVNCAHGKFPVPAPATAEILKDIPVKLGIVEHETTTPTGAAILASLVDEFTDTPEFKINKTAYGIGHMDFEIPNVLRVHIADIYEENTRQFATMLECNIDDMPGEHFEFIMDRLFEEGAHDVFLNPIIMKKSRPGIILSVLCSSKDEYQMKDILFTESTTLGIRSYKVEKSSLEREIRTVNTRFGKIEVKVARQNGIDLKLKPEYEQCKKASIEHNVPLRDVMKEVIDASNLHNAQI